MSTAKPRRAVLTANRPADGAVVYLDFEGAWSEELSEAIVAEAPDELRALWDRASYDEQRNAVLAPALIGLEELSARLLGARGLRASRPNAPDHLSRRGAEERGGGSKAEGERRDVAPIGAAFCS